MLYARRFISAFVVSSLLVAPLIAQPALSKPDGELAVLIDGLGSYSRPISTKSELAQKFFNQGLRLVYGREYLVNYVVCREQWRTICGEPLHRSCMIRISRY